MLVICGIVAPILYSIVGIVLGHLTPGYRHPIQLMSELGAVGAPYSIIMNIFGFGLLGLLLTLFSIGLSKGTCLAAGPFLIALSGLGLMLTGAFPCDPGCISFTIIGSLHSVFATMTGVLMVVGILMMAHQFRFDMKWNKYWRYTFLTGLLTALLGTGLLLLNLPGWAGVMQRLTMAIPLLWIELISIRLLRLDK